MIFYDKKRTLYALLISVIVILLFVFIGIPLMYKWNRKIDQFDNLKIQQVSDTIKVSFLPTWTISWTIVQQVNIKQESVIFSFTWSNDALKSSYIFSLNWLVGYEMCYENGLDLYCFWKTK